MLVSRDDGLSLDGVGRIRYQTISGPQSDPFRYLSISVPHETRCRVRDHHQYRKTSTISVPPVRYHLDHFGTKFYFENCSSLHCADCSANKGRCSLFNVWYRNRPGIELDPVPKRYWYRTGHRLVPKWTGTEVVSWYRTRPFWYRNGLVPNASDTECDVTRSVTIHVDAFPR